MKINYYAVWEIYRSEMMRFFETLTQSLASPVISTSLYFIVFGSAIGSRIQEVEGISYGSFIVPGMLMFALLTQTVANAGFGVFYQKFSGTIYELLSAPVSSFEIVAGFIGAATTKSVFIGSLIIVTASLFVDLQILHPWLTIFFLLLICITFSMVGFIIGIMSKNFEQLQIVPVLIITPLVFLGGSFYSISMLPELWQKISLFNPILYLISGLRWSFFEISDVNVYTSLMMISIFLFICLLVIWLLFRTGYRIKN